MSLDELLDFYQNGYVELLDDDGEEVELYDEYYEQDDLLDFDGVNGLFIEGNILIYDKLWVDFWIL